MSSKLTCLSLVSGEAETPAYPSSHLCFSPHLGFSVQAEVWTALPPTKAETKLIVKAASLPLQQDKTETEKVVGSEMSLPLKKKKKKAENLILFLGHIQFAQVIFSGKKKKKLKKLL